jgi:hypothetical protein
MEKIYIGRWDLLPKEWEGYNGLFEKSEEEIKAEVSREVNIMEEDSFIAIYEPDEFEETFNQCLTRFISSREYWIKIF